MKSPKLVTVYVKTGSSRALVLPFDTNETNNELAVYVHERPVGGKANEAVIKALSQYFGVAKSRVKIVRGETSRVKLVSVE
ncbi:MAG: DUF167 domain-containing protein [Candidatus Saccharimonadales bacterium]